MFKRRLECYVNSVTTPLVWKLLQIFKLFTEVLHVTEILSDHICDKYLYTAVIERIYEKCITKLFNLL